MTKDKKHTRNLILCWIIFIVGAFHFIAFASVQDFSFLNISYGIELLLLISFFLLFRIHSLGSKSVLPFGTLWLAIAMYQWIQSRELLMSRDLILFSIYASLLMVLAGTSLILSILDIEFISKKLDKIFKDPWSKLSL